MDIYDRAEWTETAIDDLKATIEHVAPIRRRERLSENPAGTVGSSRRRDTPRAQPGRSG